MTVSWRFTSFSTWVEAPCS